MAGGGIRQAIRYVTPATSGLVIVFVTGSNDEASVRLGSNLRDIVAKRNLIWARLVIDFRERLLIGYRRGVRSNEDKLNRFRKMLHLILQPTHLRAIREKIRPGAAIRQAGERGHQQLQRMVNSRSRPTKDSPRA